jgi:hypothetical protein
VSKTASKCREVDTNMAAEDIALPGLREQPRWWDVHCQFSHALSHLQAPSNPARCFNIPIAESAGLGLRTSFKMMVLIPASRDQGEFNRMRIVLEACRYRSQSVCNIG